jgi:hypothetical protein
MRGKRGKTEAAMVASWLPQSGVYIARLDAKDVENAVVDV